MTATTKLLGRRLRNVGLNRQDAYRFATWFAFQVEHQGPERAISYLKAVGDCMMNVLLGLSVETVWVKTTSAGWPVALKFLCPGSSDREDYPLEVLVRVAKVARAIRLTEVTKSQVDKVVSAAIAPPGGSVEGLELLSQMINLGITTTSLPTAGLVGRPVAPAPRSPKHIARCTTRHMTTQERGMTEVTVDPPVLESLEIVMCTPALYRLPYWKESFHPLSPRFLNEYFETWQGTEKDISVGEIHATQEGAGKLRMYASPLSIVQCLLYPIHRWIDTFRRSLITDCTYNQLSGALWAQEELRQGKTLFSVDLRTATCRFPLGPQLEMLRVLGLDTVFLEALEWACTGTWDVGKELKLFPPTLAWKTGQPLGIAPSMSMFSLAHNLLLTGVAAKCGAPRDCFRVLGDDVVINHPDVYTGYTTLMGLCDVPISTNKSHISDQFAEFAGYTITPDLLIRAGQWRKAEMKNHLSLARELRTPLYGEVSKDMIEAEKLDLFSLGIYDPPEWLWGKYLRANTALIYREVPYTDGSLYSRKVREYYRKLFNNSINGVYPEFIADESDEVDFIFKPINDLVSQDPIRYGWLTPHYYGVRMQAQHSIFAACWTLLTILSSMTHVHGREHVFQLLYKEVRGRLMSIVWKSNSANPFNNADYQHTETLLKVLRDSS